MDTKHGMKRLSLENWREPDAASLLFCGVFDGNIRSMDGDDWAILFMDITLSPTVPSEVERLFETAKGALCYGWFFYSLFAFGMEQVMRVAETSVKVKCIEIGIYVEKESFFARIQKLVAAGVIPDSEETQWHMIREMRNQGSHPDEQTILPPGPASTLVRGIANQISGLFR